MLCVLGAAGPFIAVWLLCPIEKCDDQYFLSVSSDYGRIQEDYHCIPPGTFSEGLDGLVPRLLKVYNAATKSGKKQSLKNILDCLVRDVSGRGDD